MAITPPGVGNEIQLTDALDMLMVEETLEAFHMTGKFHDCGGKLGYLKAFVEYGLRHEYLGEDFADFLRQLIGEENALKLVA